MPIHISKNDKPLTGGSTTQHVFLTGLQKSSIGRLYFECKRLLIGQYVYTQDEYIELNAPPKLNTRDSKGRLVVGEHHPRASLVQAIDRKQRYWVDWDDLQHDVNEATPITFIATEEDLNGFLGDIFKTDENE